MTVFEAGGRARTMDFQEGDVGCVEVSRPHYIENTGTEDLLFLELFPISTYQSISATSGLAHTPARLADEHLHTGEAFVRGISSEKELVVVPIECVRRIIELVTEEWHESVWRKRREERRRADQRGCAAAGEERARG